MTDATPRDQVRAIGAHASQEELLDLLDHRDTDQTHVLALLRKRELTPALVETIARHERWGRRQPVRTGIVTHHNAPRTLALRLLPLLFWKEQLKVAMNLRLATPLRMAAENRLKERLPELEAGEKISLARQAPPALLPILAGDTDPRVIRALLANPRLRERDVLAIVESGATSGAVLSAVGRSDRWIHRPAVVKALVAHHDTPVHLALSLLRRIPPRDLRKLIVEKPLPRVVQMSVERLLDGGA